VELTARRKAQEEARRKSIEDAARRKAQEEAADRKTEEDAARRGAEAEAARQQAEVEASRSRAQEEIARRTTETEVATRQPQQPAKQQRALPPPAMACQARLTQAANEGIIHFEYAKADLSRLSHRTLDLIAGIAKSCPDFSIDVEGHTDSIGAPADNKILSMRRSEAVIRYLTEAGIPSNRLRAVGHGEEQPVLPNSSSSNRAKNRRIEFTVRLQD
jgi:OOP family OmpA-OmpF porin